MEGQPSCWPSSLRKHICAPTASQTRALRRVLTAVRPAVGWGLTPAAPEGKASCPGGCGKVSFLLCKDWVSEESLLGRISKYLTILENGAWMVGRSGAGATGGPSWGRWTEGVWDPRGGPTLAVGECFFSEPAMFLITVIFSFLFLKTKSKLSPNSKH